MRPLFGYSVQSGQPVSLTYTDTKYTQKGVFMYFFIYMQQWYLGKEVVNLEWGGGITKELDSENNNWVNNVYKFN